MTNIHPPQLPTSSTHHGIERIDPFGGYKPDNWRDVLQDPSQLDPVLRGVLDDYHQHYQNSRNLPLEQTLFAELRGRMPDSLEGVPLPDGEWWYHWRYAENAAHPQYLRRRGQGPWECYFDAETQAQSHDFYDLGSLVMAPNHQRLATTLDTQGNERYRLSVQDHPERWLECADDCQPQVIWSADSEWVVYIQLDAENRGRDIRAWHPASNRYRTLYHEPDPGFFLDLCETQDGRYGLLASHQHQISEVRLLDLQDLSLSDPVVERSQGWDVDIETHHDHLIMKSNHERKDFGLYRRPIAGGTWQPLWVPTHGLVDDFAVLNDYLVVLSSIQAAPELRWCAWDNPWRTLDLPEPLSDLSLAPARTCDQAWQRLNWSSPRHPAQHWQLDLQTGELDVLKTQKIPSGHDPDDYQCTRAWAGDVPLTLLQSRAPIQGVVLYGYGAYGVSVEPSFSSARLSLVQRGIAHVTAHVRGGMEMGWHWYEQGRDHNKPRSFDDFEAALDYCLTLHSQVVIHGGSAGGMLVGALLNRRPQDIAGMLADVPFMDVLNTMLDADLPLTPPEWPEWGNPIESSEAFARIGSYSPYDNLAPAPYPPVLVTAGLTDPRVTFWEPMKYCARLAQCSQNSVYLRMEELGHSGPSGRFGPLQEVAECYSWILQRFNQTDSCTPV